MKIFIVYAHPDEKSFTRQIFDQLKKGLTEARHQIQISDLYQMNFRSDLSSEEYEREGKVNLELPVPEDVKLEQQKLEWADCVIFIYPVWWSDCPAKLKGWFDRVYTVGYAYGYDKNGNTFKAMKKIPFGLALCTAGHPLEFLEQIGIARSMRNVMVDDRLGKRFDVKEMIILGGSLNLANVQKKHLENTYQIGKNLLEFFSSNFKEKPKSEI